MTPSLTADRRRLRLVQRLQIVQRSAVLDALCEIGVRGAAADFGICTLVDDRMHRVLGRFGTGVEGFPRLPGPVPGDGAPVCEPQMRARPEWAAHPMVDGRLESMGAAVLTPVRHDGEVVGMIGLGWRDALGGPCRKEREIVQRMAEVAEVQIHTEATFARMAQDAFRHLERLRD